MNKEALKKQFLRSKPVRTCRKCGTTFKQLLGNKECPFCGASDNKREKNKAKVIDRMVIKGQLMKDPLYRLERGL